MNSKLDCTIILLSYNSLKVTDTCLAKLGASIDYSKKILKNNIKVIVVDNGSKDGSPEMIKKKYKWVRLIALKENIGYAAGNNLAMSEVKTPYFILMNSDTYINEDSISKSLQNIDKKADCDVLVSRWVTSDGVFHNYGGYLPTPLTIILWSFGLESIPFVKNYLHKIYSYNDDFYKREGRMEWCPPCFMLLKKRVYTLTKGFDERLWFHMVDVEWCRRMQKNGLSICYTPTVEVVHLGGASSKGLKNSLITDNFKGLLHFCRTHYPKSVHSVFLFVILGLRIRGFFYKLIGKKALAGTYNNIAKELKV